MALVYLERSPNRFVSIDKSPLLSLVLPTPLGLAGTSSPLDSKETDCPLYQEEKGPLQISKAAAEGFTSSFRTSFRSCTLFKLLFSLVLDRTCRYILLQTKQFFGKTIIHVQHYLLSLSLPPNDL